MPKIRLDTWTTREDEILTHNRALKMNSYEIALILKLEGYTRTPEAVYSRAKRLKLVELRIPKEDDSQVDLESHRIDCAMNKHADESFQRALRREGYRQHCSTKAGTDSPKIVAPVSVGSCTSSAGWAV